MADTRKDRRAPVSLKVRFKSATVDEFIEHYCKDVSKGGIFIKSSQPMVIGTLLKFQFQLKDESSLIKGVGRVVWVRSPEDAVADQPAGMGIKFIKMDNESRAMVDRIVDEGGVDGGAFDEGRATASEAEATSERPPAGEGSFFPDLEPAELPPPEDRTAVRQAAQFLAAVFAEGSTDEAALNEAEQKAEEARTRTAQIEAQRMAEAEKKPGLVPRGSLPSMIIDPTLGDEELGNDEVTVARNISDLGLEPIGRTLPPPAAPVPAALPSITPAIGLDVTPTAQSPAPSKPPAPPAKKSPLIPAAILAGVVAVAAYVATREKPSEVETPLTTADQNSQAEQPPEPSAPEPTLEPTLPPEPAVSEDAAVAAEPAEPAGTPVPTISIAVSTVPKDAEVFVGGVSRGTAPVTLQLPDGVVSVVSARAPGHLEVLRELTASATQKKPLKLVLAPLPYVVHVISDPPGAKVTIANKRGTAPTDLDLGFNFKGTMAVTARLDGYQTGRAPIALGDFSPTAENMLATVNVKLEVLPEAPVAPKPARVAKPAALPKPSADAGAATEKPTSEPAKLDERPPADKPEEKPAAAKPEEKPAVDKPAPEKPVETPAEKPAEKPAPKPEGLPDNPFG